MVILPIPRGFLFVGLVELEDNSFVVRPSDSAEDITVETDLRLASLGWEGLPILCVAVRQKAGARIRVGYL